MSDHVQKTISDLQRHLQSIEDEAADTKHTINSLCKATGKPPLYANTDAKSAYACGPMRTDLYYGKPLASVVRMILESRQAIDLGPATVAEIYDQMIEGGFVFDGANVDNRKRVLRISLAKNTATFHKLPSGSYGLTEWYPAIRHTRKNGGTKAPEDEVEEIDDESPNNEPEAVPVATNGSALALAVSNKLPETNRKPR